MNSQHSEPGIRNTFDGLNGFGIATRDKRLGRTSGRDFDQQGCGRIAEAVKETTFPVGGSGNQSAGGQELFHSRDVVHAFARGYEGRLAAEV